MHNLPKAAIHSPWGVGQRCSVAAYAYAMGTQGAIQDVSPRVQALDSHASMLVYLDGGYNWVKTDILNDVAGIGEARPR